MTNLLLILIGVLLNAGAQLVLKKGMSQIGTVHCTEKRYVADRHCAGRYKCHTHDDFKSQHQSVRLDRLDVLRHQLSRLADGLIPRGSKLRLSIFEHRLYHRRHCRLFLFRRVHDFIQSRRHRHHLYRRISVIPFLIL